MWPNPLETADLVTLTESLMENFIFYAVHHKIWILTKKSSNIL